MRNPFEAGHAKMNVRSPNVPLAPVDFVRLVRNEGCPRKDKDAAIGLGVTPVYVGRVRNMIRHLAPALLDDWLKDPCPPLAILVRLSKESQQNQPIMLAQIRARIRAREMRIAERCDEWYTPAPIIEAARTAMGSIDTDPASCAIAQRIVRANRFYTIKEDGLKQIWTGNIWLNAPFSKLRLWVQSALQRLASGEIRRACVLVPTGRSDCQWYAPLLEHPLCIHGSRIRFYGPNGQETPRPGGSAIVGLAVEGKMMMRGFSSLGAVVQKLRSLA